MALHTAAKCFGAGCLLLGGTLLTSWGLLADVAPGHSPFTSPRLGLRRPVATTAPPVRETPAVRTGRGQLAETGDVTLQTPERSLPRASADALQALLPPLGEVDPQPELCAAERGLLADRPVASPAALPQIPADLFIEPNSDPASPKSAPAPSEDPGADDATTGDATSADSHAVTDAAESPRVSVAPPAATAGRAHQMLSLRGQPSHTSVRQGRAQRADAAQATSPAAGDSPAQSLTLVASEEAPSLGRGELTPPAPVGSDDANAADGVTDRLQQPLASVPTRLQSRRLPRVLPPGQGATSADYDSLFRRTTPLMQPALALHLPPPRRYTYDFQHRPLYFEQPGLERCGRSFGCATSVVSATAFLAQTALLPYQVLALGPCTHVSPLGDCPCGTLYPWCAAIPAPCDAQYDTTECHVE